MASLVALAPSNLVRPPVMWSPLEVKAWLDFCVEEFALNPVCVDKFDMNGKALCLLTRKDFMERAPRAGDVLYNAFQRLREQQDGSGISQCRSKQDNISSSPPSFPFFNTDWSRSPPSQNLRPTFKHILPLLPSTTSNNTTNNSSSNNNHINSNKYNNRSSDAIGVLSACGDEAVIIVPNLSMDIPCGSSGSMLSPPSSEKCASDSDSSQTGQSPHPDVHPALSPQGPKKEKEEEEGDDCDMKPEATNHIADTPGASRLLWEFIYYLLREGKHQDLVCWESLPDLTFRINNPMTLAELWGMQKNRDNMTYEKLSRALRYYYKMNIIRKVPGKRLTYQFLQHPGSIKKGQRGARPHAERILAGLKTPEMEHNIEEQSIETLLSTAKSPTLMSSSTLPSSSTLKVGSKANCSASDEPMGDNNDQVKQANTDVVPSSPLNIKIPHTPNFGACSSSSSFEGSQNSVSGNEPRTSKWMSCLHHHDSCDGTLISSPKTEVGCTNESLDFGRKDESWQFGVEKLIPRTLESSSQNVHTQDIKQEEQRTLDMGWARFHDCKGTLSPQRSRSYPSCSDKSQLSPSPSKLPGVLTYSSNNGLVEMESQRQSTLNPEFKRQTSLTPESHLYFHPKSPCDASNDAARVFSSSVSPTRSPLLIRGITHSPLRQTPDARHHNRYRPYPTCESDQRLPPKSFTSCGPSSPRNGFYKDDAFQRNSRTDNSYPSRNHCHFFPMSRGTNVSDILTYPVKVENLAGEQEEPEDLSMKPYVPPPTSSKFSLPSPRRVSNSKLDFHGQTSNGEDSDTSSPLSADDKLYPESEEVPST